MAEQMPSSQIEVINPETGEPGFIPAHQLEDAVAQGFTEVTPEDKLQQKYGGLGQQALTALEGLGVGATFGASSALESAAGVPSEDILGRREANPGAYMLGQGAALLAPFGAAKAVTAGGKAAAAALGFTEASLASKIGSAATKAAVENALVASGDEVSKMILQDPQQSVETAALNVGLAGIIGAPFGAALGAVSPLWTATEGSKVGGVLRAVLDKAGGAESVIPDALREAIDSTGLEIAPEIKAGLIDDPTIKNWFMQLQESQATKSAKEFQASYDQFRKNVGEKLLETMGRTPLDIPEEFSTYQAGKNLGEMLESEFRANVDPTIEIFETLRERYKNEPVFSDVMKKVADDIGQLVQENRWNLSKSSPEMKVVKDVLDDLPNLKTIDDLTKYQSQLGDRTANFNDPATMKAGQQIKQVLRDAETESVKYSLGQTAPEMLANHEVARQAWRNASELRDKLDDIVKVPGSDKIGTWLNDLKSFATTDGEKIWQRLGNAKNVDLLNTLKNNFPNTFEMLQEFQLDQMLQKVGSKAKPDEVVNSKALIKAIGNLSPEQRALMIPEMGKVEQLANLLETFDSLKWNTSHTALSLDRMWQSMPGTAVGLVTGVLSEMPGVGLVVGALNKFISRDAPEAVKLGLLKFLGSEGNISPQGFKAMAEFIDNAYKGRMAVQKAAGNIFKAGREVLPSAYKVKESDIKKLDKRVEEIKREPQALLDVGGHVSDYMPEQSQSMAQFAASAANYLGSLKPEPKKLSPLDKPIEPSVEAKNDYYRALEIAQSPLTIFEKIKEGTLTSRDVVHLNNLYPGLVQQFRSQLLDHVMDLDPDNAKLPYKTKVSLSLFLGQPLDSTMTPTFLQATQLPGPQAQQQQSQTAPKARQLSKLDKVASNDRTAAQAREVSRATRQ